MATTTGSVSRCGCTQPADCVDQRAGRYLTAIHWLASNRQRRVHTGEVSDRLDVTPATVTETFERLAADALVEYEKRDGVTLTDRGEAVARELAWRQCVVRAFFATELGVGDGAGNDYQFGFLLSKDGIQGLHRRLDVSPVEYCERRTAQTEDCACRAHAN